MKEILEELEIYLGDATEAATRGDEDAWLTAMSNIRDCAWEGKTFILDKRMAEWRAGRNVLPLKTSHTKPRVALLPVSTIEDMLND